MINFTTLSKFKCPPHPTNLLTCPKTDFTIGWRLESYSEDAAFSLLVLRLAAGRTGALVAGASELRLDDDPVMTLSLDSKKKAASSWCLG